MKGGRGRKRGDSLRWDDCSSRTLLPDDDDDEDESVGSSRATAQQATHNESTSEATRMLAGVCVFALGFRETRFAICFYPSNSPRRRPMRPKKK